MPHAAGKDQKNEKEAACAARISRNRLPRCGAGAAMVPARLLRPQGRFAFPAEMACGHPGPRRPLAGHRASKAGRPKGLPRSAAAPSRPARGPALAGLTSRTRTEGHWNTTAITGHKRTLVRLRQQAEKLQGWQAVSRKAEPQPKPGCSTVWFHACWLFATAKDGISAQHLQRALEIGSYTPVTSGSGGLAVARTCTTRANITCTASPPHAQRKSRQLAGRGMR
jgi:hypothetical protein